MQKVCEKNTVGLNLHTKTMRNRFAVTQILSAWQIPPVWAYNPGDVKDSEVFGLEPQLLSHLMRKRKYKPFVEGGI